MTCIVRRRGKLQTKRQFNDPRTCTKYQSNTTTYLQSGIRDADESHLLDTSRVELAHDAVLEGALVLHAVAGLRTVEQLVRVCGLKYKKMPNIKVRESFRQYSERHIC